MTEILILDGFCCDGGAAEGYRRAAVAAEAVELHIIGIDIVKRPNYAGHEMIVDDAVDFIRKHGHEFHSIHVSPPCQSKCALTVGTNESRGWGGEHVDLVAPTREAILATGRPYVLEQPNGRAEIRKDVRLCGEMFGLGVLRHRNFELGDWSMPNPKHPKHRGYVRGWRHGVYRDGPYVAAYGDGGGKATVAEMQAAMEIDWTDDAEALREAIPPAYTGLIGRHLLEHLAATR